MTTAHIENRASRPVTYEIRIAGHLDNRWSDWLGANTLVHHDDPSTTLTVEVLDQAQLHAVLTRIRDVGVSLLSVNICAAPNSALDP